MIALPVSPASTAVPAPGSVFKYCPHCGAPLSPRLMDEVERLACIDQCGFVHWNNPTPVVAALVHVSGSFILARNAAWPAGWFSLITGFLEAGELPGVAVARETHEELGLKADRVTFVGHYPIRRFNQIVMAFVVDASGEPQTSPEIAEFRRLTLDELKAYDFGPLKLGQSVVRDWLASGA